MASLVGMGFKDRIFGEFLKIKAVPKAIFGQGLVYRMIPVQYVEAKTLEKPWQDRVMDLGAAIAKAASTMRK
jgi:hypothetical protein